MSKIYWRVTKLTNKKYNTEKTNGTTRLESPRSKLVAVDELMQFPNLQYLDNIEVDLRSVEDAEKMARLSKLQKGTFAIFAGVSPQDIFDTYITNLCKNARNGLLGRYLAFIVNPGGEMTVLDRTLVWTYRRLRPINPRSLLDCTGLREIKVSNDRKLWSPVKEQKYAEMIGDDVQIVPYDIDVVWVNDNTMKLLEKLPYTDKLLKRLFVSHYRVIKQKALDDLFLMGLINNGNVPNLRQIQIPEAMLIEQYEEDPRTVHYEGMMSKLKKYNHPKIEGLFIVRSPIFLDTHRNEIEYDAALIDTLMQPVLDNMIQQKRPKPRPELERLIEQYPILYNVEDLE